TLGFVCLHLRWHGHQEPAALYFLIEPIDPAAPTLFRTRNWHLNCLAPRFKNDPISVPELAPQLHMLEQRLRALDDVAGEPLADFWRRTKREISATLGSLPPSFQVV